MINVILRALKKASAAAFSGYWLGPPLIRPPCVLLPFFPGLSLLRAPPPRCGRLQARRRTERLPTISPLAIDLRARPFRRARAVPLGRDCVRQSGGVLVWGWDGGGYVVPFSPIIIHLLPLACRCLHCLCVSGVILDNAEHSWTDLDLCDQLNSTVGLSPSPWRKRPPWPRCVAAARPTTEQSQRTPEAEHPAKTLCKIPWQGGRPETIIRN